MRARLRSVWSVLAAVAVVLVMAPPARATTVDPINPSRSNNPATKTYKGTLKTATPAFLDRPVDTSGETPAPGDGDWHLADCKQTPSGFQNFCDAVPVVLDTGIRNGFRVYVEVSWEGGRDQMAPVRLYYDDGTKLTDLEADAQRPDPGNQRQRNTIVDMQSGRYWLGVACRTGASPCASAYTVFIQIHYEARFTPPPEGGPVTQFTPQPTASASGGPSSAAGSPAPPVLTPGADGPSSEKNLKGVAVGQQAQAPSNTTALVTNVIAGILLAMILFGGGAFVAIKIRRDLGR